MTANVHTTREPGASSFTRITCAALGGWLLTFGLWALLAPASFFTVIATFEPFNEHLIHDAGALQVGLGLALLLTAAQRGGAVVALGGFVAFAGLHVVSHAVDRELGARPFCDLTFLALVTLIGAAALVCVLRGEPSNRLVSEPIQQEPAP